LRRGQRIYSRKARAKKGYRARRTARFFVFTVGFIVFVSLSLYSLYYTRKKISQEIPEKGFSPSDLASLIEDIDGYIADALFNLGVSIRDVKSKKVIEREEREIRWKFKDMVIDLPEGVTEKKVRETLTKSLSKPNIESKLKKSNSSLILEIEAYNVSTHKIRFDFYEKKQEEEASTPPKEQAKVTIEEKTPPKETVEAFRKEKPKVVIIVDDLGLNKEPVDELLKLPAPLNFAVLPNLPYSRYAAEMAHRKGWDVILHLPMEPKDSSGYTGVDAGDGALLVGLPKSEILSKLDKNLASVPYIKGVNNHMGSKFTENGELMELVLRRIKDRGLFFIDSKTSQNTTGYQIAKKLKVKTAKRDVFLDKGLHGEDYVRSQIERLIKVSKARGLAIGICHPYPDTLMVLADTIPKIKEEVDIIPASVAVDCGSGLRSPLHPCNDYYEYKEVYNGSH